MKLVNQQDSTGATALHYAAQGGFLKVRLIFIPLEFRIFVFVISVISFPFLFTERSFIAQEWNGSKHKKQ